VEVMGNGLASFTAATEAPSPISEGLFTSPVEEGSLGPHDNGVVALGHYGQGRLVAVMGASHAFKVGAGGAGGRGSCTDGDDDDRLDNHVVVITVIPTIITTLVSISIMTLSSPFPRTSSTRSFPPPSSQVWEPTLPDAPPLRTLSMNDIDHEVM
jgi:hypothetical protein